MNLKFLPFFFLLTVLTSFSAAQDSLRLTKLILPAGLIGTGSVFMNRCEGPNCFNRPAYRLFYEKMSGRHIHIDDGLQYAPVVAYLCIPGREKFYERFMAASTAALLTWGLTLPIKETAGERRPDLKSDNSFPSGHTATAFMGAELLRLSGQPKKIVIPAYLAAAAVGCFRIHNNRHWFNDVVAGAGFGILSARIAYWLLPAEKKLVKKLFY